MGCGSSVASQYKGGAGNLKTCPACPARPVENQASQSGKKPKELRISSTALKFLAQGSSPDVSAIHYAHYAPEIGLKKVGRVEADNTHNFASEGAGCNGGHLGPWDKEDLSFGPSCGPLEFQPFDRDKISRLPIQKPCTAGAPFAGSQSYIVGGVLAKTDNCEVYLGAFSRTKVAVKRISKELSAQPFQTHVNEVRCLLRLQHERIVKLLGVFDSGDSLDIVLEYCRKGALRNYVTENCNPEHLFQILCDVAEALTFMHGEWFAHLDIKPHNILVEDVEQDSGLH
ncbi:unnamed protein product [Durusdinium trenchii]|uniref:Protein kinase domain-containing protein n=1 Tax=Durusdinium trenchii TaxID=1381693 RepID=A0ABP0JI10_9DINO